MVEPLSRSLALAPVEDEEITPETAEALNHAKASLARGEGIPHEEILREFGLTKHLHTHPASSEERRRQGES